MVQEDPLRLRARLAGGALFPANLATRTPEASTARATSPAAQLPPGVRTWPTVQASTVAAARPLTVRVKLPVSPAS